MAQWTGFEPGLLRGKSSDLPIDSSIGYGGTSTLFYMMEQFDSTGVPAHF